MKLLDIMKKYDRCLVRESAKLTKIYNMILKESEIDQDVNEEACPDCGNDPCTCDETDKVVKADSLFDSEDDADNLTPESDSVVADSEEVEENDMLRNRPHNAHVDDPAGVMNETDAEDDNDAANDDAETDVSITAEEFFAECDKSDDAKIDEDDDNAVDEEEMMSAEDFFKSVPASDVKEDEDAEECDSGKLNEFEDRMISAKTLLEKDDDNVDEDDDNVDEDDEKALQESLKSYRRKNHHLFNG